MSLAEFLEYATENYSGNTDTDYLQAVYQFAEYFALDMSDADSMLETAEDCYGGNFARSADYGESVGEEYLSERLDAIQEIAMQEPHIPYTIDWEQFAELVLPNTYGWNWESFNDDSPGTGAYYFREPR